MEMSLTAACVPARLSLSDATEQPRTKISLKQCANNRQESSVQRAESSLSSTDSSLRKAYIEK